MSRQVTAHITEILLRYQVPHQKPVKDTAGVICLQYLPRCTVSVQQNKVKRSMHSC